MCDIYRFMEQSLNKLYIILNISYHFQICKVAFLQGNKYMFVLITNKNVIKKLIEVIILKSSLIIKLKISKCLLAIENENENERVIISSHNTGLPSSVCVVDCVVQWPLRL